MARVRRGPAQVKRDEELAFRLRVQARLAAFRAPKLLKSCLKSKSRNIGSTSVPSINHTSVQSDTTHQHSGDMGPVRTNRITFREEPYVRGITPVRYDFKESNP